ncbi:MAG TPA: V-type ATP synthase subunit F [Candidatus Dormibacteraeota bacterium]|nr:V-type ATP synthase subunit F [Candidatus Dormibacteraeota bacterium]
MSSIVALGRQARLAGFHLAGVEVIPTDSPEEAVSALRRLGTDVGVLILTPEAAAAVAPIIESRRLLSVVIPSAS